MKNLVLLAGLISALLVITGCSGGQQIIDSLPDEEAISPKNHEESSVNCDPIANLVFESKNQSNALLANAGEAENVFWEYKMAVDVKPVLNVEDKSWVYEKIPYTAKINNGEATGWLPVPYGVTINNSNGEKIIIGLFVTNDGKIYDFSCE